MKKKVLNQKNKILQVRDRNEWRVEELGDKDRKEVLKMVEDICNDVSHGYSFVLTDKGETSRCMSRSTGASKYAVLRAFFRTIGEVDPVVVLSALADRSK